MPAVPSSLALCYAKARAAATFMVHPIDGKEGKVRSASARVRDNQINYLTGGKERTVAVSLPFVLCGTSKTYHISCST